MAALAAGGQRPCSQLSLFQPRRDVEGRTGVSQVRSLDWAAVSRRSKGFADKSDLLKTQAGMWRAGGSDRTANFTQSRALRLVIVLTMQVRDAECRLGTGVKPCLH